ncbi:reelin domain-containing protein 1 isoform X2 [Diorhabda carinulata]|uniref:reelin domain-containing protein 1 isoform X2 n=1 Tax=Diorhabda carinulata TaxID=1163345 RepID=UPI0025A2004B|nr:reelin domain-containing protein 1 isoform X2 [Diorhabda carinulata]
MSKCTEYFIFMCLILGVSTFPDGAPVDACVKERVNQPHHGQARSQPPETSPYQVLQSAADYGPGTQITVTIQGVANFKGFLIQARDVVTNEWIGQWVETPNTKIHPECSAITHSDPKPKQAATLVWQAPKNSRGQVYFTGTVLKGYSEFWSNLVSQIAA